MLIGCNLNEFNYYNRALITPKSMDEVKATLAERYGAENVDEYISLYKDAYPNDNRTTSDVGFRYQFQKWGD